MKHSDSIANLAAALVAVQTELRGVAKDSTNPDFKSQYTSLDAIIAVETMFVHSSGEWLSNTAIMPVVGRMLKGGGRADVDPQAGGSALTYGRRYGLSALLCLSTDEDDDGNRASERSSGKGRAANRSTGATTQPAPTAPTLTRDTIVGFAPKRKDGSGVTVKELPLEFLAWAVDPSRKATAFGEHTKLWQTFLRAEMEARETGELHRVD